MKLFKTVDEKLAEIGFAKVEEDKYGCIYERKDKEYNFTHFNSQPHKGLTGMLEAIACIKLIFQLTAPQGADLRRLCTLHTLVLFQLTAPQGADLTLVHFMIFAKYFNSQPHKGLTGGDEEMTIVYRYFNSQPHKGLTGSSSCTLSGILIFQLTAPQGADHRRNEKMVLG